MAVFTALSSFVWDDGDGGVAEYREGQLYDEADAGVVANAGLFMATINGATDPGLQTQVDAVVSLADSLESGDAWSGAQAGRVLTSGTPPTWEVGGGGADLSAVDQDITVHNGHVINLQGADSDPQAHASISWNDDTYGMQVQGNADDGTSRLYIVDPTEPGTKYAIVRVGSTASQLALVQGSNALQIVIGPSGPATVQNDLAFYRASAVTTFGPVIEDSDNVKWRIVVSTLGVLSTEPVT